MKAFCGRLIRADKGIPGRIRGELVNDNTTECFPRNVHALPERACGEENGMHVFSELVEEYGLGRISLLEEAERKLSFQDLIDHVEVVMAREENQRPACRDAEQVQNLQPWRGNGSLVEVPGTAEVSKSWKDNRCNTRRPPSRTNNPDTAIDNRK
jgi:hypothetical protein